MKKLIILTAVWFVALASVPVMETSAYTVYRGQITPGERSSATTYTRSRTGYRPFRYRSTQSTQATRDTSSNVAARYNRQTRSYTPRRTTNRTTTQSTNYVSRYGSRSSISNRSAYARVYATPIPQNKAADTINGSVIPVMEIGIKHEAGSRSSLRFQEAVLVDSLQFQMYANNGIAREPKDFELTIDDESVPFDKDGNVTVKLNNASRISSGGSLNYQIGVKFRDPNLVSSQSGSFRLRLVGTNVLKETSSTKVPVQVSGQGMSDVIAFNPDVRVSGGTGVFTSVPTNDVYSSSLQSGQAATVLSVGLSAQYDDLLVRKVTVRNITGGSLIDNLVERIDAVDGNTGEILGSTRFFGGKAQFDFNPDVYIKRNGRRDIAFVAHIEDTLPSISGNASFELTLAGSDFDVVSVSTGNTLPGSGINVSVRNNTYSVVGSSVSVSTNNQPSNLIVSDSLNTVFRFQVSNPGGTEISLGRVSLGLYPTGISYPGGMSVDDFELVRVVNGREIRSTLFTTTSASGQVVIFDTITEEYISPRSTAEYALKARIENVGGTNGDALGVQLLSDSEYKRSSLTGLRSSGKSFIWSDHSGRPHQSGSTDWLTGYLVNGLNSDVKVLKR